MLFLTTYYYENLEEKEQNKVANIVDKALEEGWLEINSLLDLHSFVDNLIVNGDLSKYAQNGELKEIFNLTVGNGFFNVSYVNEEGEDERTKFFVEDANELYEELESLNISNLEDFFKYNSENDWYELREEIL